MHADQAAGIPTTDPPPKKIRFRWVLLPTWSAGLFTVSGYLGGSVVLFDWTSQFKVQYAACLLICLPFLVFGRWRRTAVCALVFLSLILFEIAPFYLPPGNETPSHNLRVLLANVNYGNREHQPFFDLIEKESPDVIAILEYARQWHDHLVPFLNEYPHHIEWTLEDPFGIALYSRIPLDQAEISFFGEAKLPSITARLEVSGRPLQLVATHPFPPTNGRWFELRNQQLDNIAEFIRAADDPVILLGDLNCTPFSPAYKDFTRSADLKSTRDGFGLNTTWPETQDGAVKKSMAVILQIAIDHIMIDQEIQVKDCRRGPVIGSDHRPLLADLYVPPQPDGN
jgi:endonuclease/exonuclease/phosphatase (EEP) superfamily protein YafD